MQKSIELLIDMGRMPDESEDHLETEVIDKYVELIANISKPIDLQEAAALVALFPESGLFGAEWTLLHIIETAFDKTKGGVREYKNAIDKCPSEEWKNRLNIRLQDWINNNA